MSPAAHRCGLVVRRAWMGPIVDVFVTHYFAFAWRETKDDELMGLNILLQATGIGPCNDK